jgi:hypothetical protein
VKKFAPWLIGFFLIGWAVVKMLPPGPAPGFDIDGFARLPVLVGGRVMPMDTLGRLSLLAMNHFGTPQMTARFANPPPGCSKCL